jgi:hypothetical protein
MAEMIYELIFDFINGKTKSFKFNSKTKAIACMDAFRGLEVETCTIENTIVFTPSVCSISYNSYEKPGDE